MREKGKERERERERERESRFRDCDFIKEDLKANPRYHRGLIYPLPRISTSETRGYSLIGVI
jgi:hypothetical protein